MQRVFCQVYHQLINNNFTKGPRNGKVWGINEWKSNFLWRLVWSILFPQNVVKFIGMCKNRKHFWPLQEKLLGGCDPGKCDPCVLLHTRIYSSSITGRRCRRSLPCCALLACCPQSRNCLIWSRMGAPPLGELQRKETKERKNCNHVQLMHVTGTTILDDLSRYMTLTHWDPLGAVETHKCAHKCCSC